MRIAQALGAPLQSRARERYGGVGGARRDRIDRGVRPVDGIDGNVAPGTSSPDSESYPITHAVPLQNTGTVLVPPPATAAPILAAA